MGDTPSIRAGMNPSADNTPMACKTCGRNGVPISTTAHQRLVTVRLQCPACHVSWEYTRADPDLFHRR
jgi:hypothetical protein